MSPWRGVMSPQISHVTHNEWREHILSHLQWYFPKNFPQLETQARKSLLPKETYELDSFVSFVSVKWDLGAWASSFGKRFENFQWKFSEIGSWRWDWLHTCVYICIYICRPHRSHVDKIGCNDQLAVSCVVLKINHVTMDDHVSTNKSCRRDEWSTDQLAMSCFVLGINHVTMDESRVHE